MRKITSDIKSSWLLGIVLLAVTAGRIQAAYEVCVHRAPAISTAAASPQYDIQIHRVARGIEAEQIATGAEVGSPAPMSDLKRVAVKLRAKGAFASGVNISRGILTCAHVVEGHAEFTVECDGETATARVVSTDKKNDIALLSVAWKMKHQEAALADEPPRRAETLHSAGRCKDGTLTVETHDWIETGRFGIQFTNPPQTGRSGSGLFDSQDRLIGIVSRTIIEDDGKILEPYIGEAASIEHVLALIGQKPKKLASVSPKFGLGMHSHECPKCGAVWSHSEASFGSVADHTCPKCGKAVVWDKSSKPVAVAAATAASPQPTVSRPAVASCPNGNCPWVSAPATRRRR